jgi:hypothetical protein
MKAEGERCWGDGECEVAYAAARGGGIGNGAAGGEVRGARLHAGREVRGRARVSSREVRTGRPLRKCRRLSVGKSWGHERSL